MTQAARKPALGRTSLVHKPGTADADTLERDFTSAAAQLQGEDKARMAPHLLRVSQGVENLRRVSQAVNLQRKSMAPAKSLGIKE